MMSYIFTVISMLRLCTGIPAIKNTLFTRYVLDKRGLYALVFQFIAIPFQFHVSRYCK